MSTKAKVDGNAVTPIVQITSNLKPFGKFKIFPKVGVKNPFYLFDPCYPPKKSGQAVFKYFTEFYNKKARTKCSGLT